jgi:hypothetical protein
MNSNFAVTQQEGHSPGSIELKPNWYAYHGYMLFVRGFRFLQASSRKSIVCQMVSPFWNLFRLALYLGRSLVIVVTPTIGSQREASR